MIPRLLDEIKMLKDSGLAAEVHSGRLHNLEEVHALLACKDISTSEVSVVCREVTCLPPVVNIGLMSKY